MEMNNNFLEARNFSDDSSKIAFYEEIKDLPNHKEKLLIDVREPQELIDTGIIPTSINIPRKHLLIYRLVHHIKKFHLNAQSVKFRKSSQKNFQMRNF